ncbi:hypothetical protein QVD17_16855 [Tagetes erecta]|uniref:Uncharacterized protein n=1 Tax=Tagetes erecta TaxID=13708 RepID=A0AAD8NZU1_TARER|nr:hypothetical protein QVD17_16855 [Tagetes erecta]
MDANQVSDLVEADLTNVSAVTTGTRDSQTFERSSNIASWDDDLEDLEHEKGTVYKKEICGYRVQRLHLPGVEPFENSWWNSKIRT